jgi:hypothetical protein
MRARAANETQPTGLCRTLIGYAAGLGLDGEVPPRSARLAWQLVVGLGALLRLARSARLAWLVGRRGAIVAKRAKCAKTSKHLREMPLSVRSGMSLSHDLTWYLPPAGSRRHHGVVSLGARPAGLAGEPFPWDP